jgi:hypothetical protein
MDAAVHIPLEAMNIAGELMEDLPMPPHTQAAILELRHAIFDLAVDVQAQGFSFLVREGWNPEPDIKEAMALAAAGIISEREQIRGFIKAGHDSVHGPDQIVLAECLEDWNLGKEHESHVLSKLKMH